MKKTKNLTALLISALVALCALALLLCLIRPTSAEEHIQDASLTTKEAETVILAAPKDSGLVYGEYRIVVSQDSFMGDMDFAVKLSDMLRGEGVTLRYSVDSKDEQPLEILFGNTNRALSAELSDICVSSTHADELVWAFKFKDGKLAFAANSDEAFTRGTKEFLELFYKDGVLSVSSDFYKLSALSRIAYEEEVRIENERIEAEAELKRQERIEELKTLIGAFKLSDFGDPEMKTSMPKDTYENPNLYPTAGEHPRLSVTSYMLDGINEFLESDKGLSLANSFWDFADSDYTGILPAAKNVTEGRVGFHNVDELGLMKIEAKALAYLLTGNEVYGYEAIYAIKNYLTTLDLRHIYSDQCREFGRTIMCAAEVYDWCYDLLTTDDKSQLILGITDICAGKNEKGAQMEVGFPPYGQGSVSGHGSERQILRDYFSVAVAIYDEDPTWYDFVAGRIYNEYVPFRNYYYQSGTYPQGINLYAPGRHYADTWSAWIMYTSVGEWAYDDTLQNIVKSFYSYELPNGTFFGTGDSSRKSDSTAFNTAAYLVMALYNDDYLYSWIYKNTGALRNIKPSNIEMSYSHIAILLSEYFSDSNNSYVPNSRYENIPTISYNGHPIGQMISRYEWQNENAPAVFMKIGERTTANHEHGDAGSFQIYYKGLYTGESGIYNNYGSTHFTYYHQATVAHNGILVYNENNYSNLVDEKGNPISPARYWYSGSQRDPGESGTLWDWLDDSKYDTGAVMGYSYGFNSDGTADYAYIAGDITAAYTSDTVDYVGRRMLAVYTGDDDFPLYFVVYDRIDSDSETFEKRFLLQAPTEPIIDSENKTVTVVQNNGKLILSSLKNAEKFTALGGKGQTFLINGVQCATDSGSEGSNWGRVEISAPKDSKSTELLNTLLVTDATNEMSLTQELIETDKLIGTRIENTVMLFAKDIDPSCESFEFQTEGKGLVRYFLSGVHTGTWSVKVDGVPVATVLSPEDGNIINFYAPCGNVTVTPGSDVPPANGGKIIYNTYGGIVPDTAPLTYEIGVPVTLPTDIKRGNDLFLGWYSDESLRDEYLITEVTATNKGRFHVYAKYKAFPLNESYEGLEINHTESNKTVNKLAYNGSGKTGSKFETVTNGENTYLKVTKGTKDPALNYGTPISDYIGTETSLTIYVDLARDGENPVYASNCRIRATGSKDVVSAFTVATDGSVLLAGKTKFMTLTESFQRVYVTVDFENSTISAYERYGKKLAEESFSPPTASSAETTLDWMHTVESTFNWYMSGADGSMLIDNLSVYAGDFTPEVEVIPDGMGKIVYSTGGKPLPEDAPKYYEIGKETPLPTLTSDIDTFIAWYTSPAFDDDTRIFSVPADATGEFNVYARWLGVYMNEDFEEVGDVSHTEEKGTFGGIKLNTGADKTGSKAYTVTDASGNTYLVFERGDKDPNLYAGETIGAFATPTHALTVEVDIGLVEGKAPAKVGYRIRAKIDGKNSNFTIFSVASDGKVLLAGREDAVLTTLTNDFQRISVTVNWDTSTFTGYLDGFKVMEIDVDLSYFSLTWLESVSSNMNFYASGGEAIKLDNFYAYTDVYPDRGLTAPDGKGNIVYEMSGGTLSSDAPKYFDKTGETPLPTPSRSGDEFLGWYTDPSFSEESKITAIPATDSDSVTVYAKWRGIFFKQDFDNVADAEFVEEKGSVGGISFNPKTGAILKTESDGAGNKYLVFSIDGESAVDPHLSTSGTVPASQGSINALTTELSLGLVSGKSALSSAFRMRARVGTQKLDLTLFSIAQNGDVLLGGNAEAVLCALDSSALTDIAVTVNFDTGMLIGYVNGTEAGTLAFDTTARGLDWLSQVTNPMYFYSKDTEGALKFDNLLFYSDIYSAE